jgi:hypothetical protein
MAESVESLFSQVEKIGLEQVLASIAARSKKIALEALIEKLACRERAIELVQLGESFRTAASRTGLSLKMAHIAARSAGKRSRPPITAERRRNIRRDLEGDQQSLLELARKHQVCAETIRRLRMQFTPYSPGACRAHLCEGCRQKINSYKCLRCDLAKSSIDHHPRFAAP